MHWQAIICFFRMHMAVLHLWLVFVCIWSYRHLQGVVDRYRSMHSFGCLTLNVINQSINLSNSYIQGEAFKTDSVASDAWIDHTPSHSIRPTNGSLWINKTKRRLANTWQYCTFGLCSSAFGLIASCRVWWIVMYPCILLDASP